MVLLYHEDAEHPVDAHPSQVENMKINGWSKDKPKEKHKPKSKTKPETDPAT